MQAILFSSPNVSGAAVKGLGATAALRTEKKQCSISLPSASQLGPVRTDGLVTIIGAAPMLGSSLLGCSSNRTSLYHSNSLFHPAVLRKTACSKTSKLTRETVHPRIRVSCMASRNGGSSAMNNEGNASTKFNLFASLSSSVGQSEPLPTPPANQGHPLLWVGVGVGLTLLLLKVQESLKQKLMKFAMSQMASAMSKGAGPGSSPSPFGDANFPFPGQAPFGSGQAPFGAGQAPFGAMPGYPPPSIQNGSAQAAAAAAPPFDTTVVETPSTPVESPGTPSAGTSTEGLPKKKSSFTDVTAELIEEQQRAAEAAAKQAQEPKKPPFQEPEVQSSTGANPSAGWGGWGSNTTSNADFGTNPFMTVEKLEEMLEYPEFQKLIMQSLPEELRNPATLKWMLQNPEFRKYLEEVTKNIKPGSISVNEAASAANEHFAAMGMTMEQATEKVMAHPELAAAFANPRIMAAIVDCSTNPQNAFKYASDREVMDVINKINQIFQLP